MTIHAQAIVKPSKRIRVFYGSFLLFSKQLMLQYKKQLIYILIKHVNFQN